jgi:hypothetical protein
MKKLLILCFSLVTLGCQKESDVAPASGTFLRYFGSENNATAVSVVEANGGYALLSNIEVPGSTSQPNSKIKLILTDEDGNWISERSYPSFPVEENEENYSASAFIALQNSGYLIIGERINSNETSDILLIQTDRNGEIVPNGEKVISLPEKSLRGTAVMEHKEDTSPSQFTILGSISNVASAEGDKDMFVAQLTSTLDTAWTRQYGAQKSTSLSKRIFLTSDEKLFWGGSILSYDQSDIRFVEVKPNDLNPTKGEAIGDNGVNEIMTDFVKVPGGWAITGSSDKNGDADIMLKKISSTTEEVYETILEMSAKNEIGNSISLAWNSGIMILGTVEYPDTQQDIFLAQFDGTNGVLQWQKNFGGPDREEAASVIRVGQQSYLIFGTTSYGRSKRLMLIKVDQNGEL